MIGLARAAVERGTELDELLVAVERDLWVLMAELATAPENRHKLQPGQSLVTDDMVDRIEAATDAISTRFAIPEGGFAVPGQDPLSARLEVARTVVRRAERRTLAVAVEGSHTIPYLNRLSSLLWALARWQEEETLPTKES
jgi:cob(I)alamin adenosyltransferase